MVTIGQVALLLVLFIVSSDYGVTALARIKPLPRKDPFSVEAAYPHRYILGSDESGVGCIAGPVVCVTCCVLDAKSMIKQCREIRDGKSLTIIQCQEIREFVEQNPDIVTFTTTQRSSQDIDEQGVYGCVQEGFQETIQSLVDKLTIQDKNCDLRNVVYSIVDGHRSPSFEEFTSRPWKQADSVVFTVAVAGCIARAMQAEIMREQQTQVPIEFQWDGGYPTPAHLQSLATHGPTEFHRTSCKPVQLHRRTALSLVLLPMLTWMKEPADAMVRERGMLLPERGEVSTAVPSDWSDIDEVREPLRRLDDSVDSIFYQEDRIVEHIDETAVNALRTYLKSIVDGNKAVLDVGASWTSHLETAGLENVVDNTIVGIGMNDNELAANKILSNRVVQDLNQNPQLPLDSKVFDIVLCQLTIDYLIRPSSVCKEIRRVLKDQGSVHVIFSNRLFLQKAVNNWTGRDDLEHVEIVASYLHFVGFHDIQAQDLSVRNKRGSVIGDPLYVVRGIA